MKKQVLFLIIIASCIFVFASMPAKAAYEFYVIKLEGFSQDKHKDWGQVNNIVRSVNGVKSVKLDRRKNEVRITCGGQGCNDTIVNKVKGELTKNRYVIRPSSYGKPYAGNIKIDTQRSTRGK